MESLSPLTIATARSGSVSLPGLVQIETSPARHGTLIRSDLVVVASHYLPPEGIAVTAITTQGEVPSVIGKIVKQIGDITVLSLKYPLEKSSVAKIASEEELKKVGEWVGTGYTSINTPSQRETAARMSFQRFQSDNAAPGAKVVFFRQSSMSKVAKGDSGSPVYVNVNGEMKLAGVFTSTNAMSSVASLVSAFKQTLEAL